MRVEISKKELHFAAFVKAHGGQLIEATDTSFVFETDKQLAEWELEHINSSDLRTDQELLKLKRLL